MATQPITYRTAGDWGAGKGSNLDADEIDNNFYNLDQRIVAILNNPPEGVSVTNIAVEGFSVMFYLSDGSTRGPFPLPYVTFRIRTPFDSSVASTYDQFDLIPVTGVGLFLSKSEHDYDIGEAFDPNRVDGDGNPVYIKVFGEDVYIYNIGWFYPGKPGLAIEDGGMMAAHLFSRPVILPAGLTGSLAKLRVAPAADLSFPITHEGTAVGSIDFATGSTDGTFTFAADVSIAEGEILALEKPDAVDAAAKDLSVTLVATRLT